MLDDQTWDVNEISKLGNGQMRIIFLHYRPDSVQGGGHGGKLPGIVAPFDLKGWTTSQCQPVLGKTVVFYYK